MFKLEKSLTYAVGLPASHKQLKMVNALTETPFSLPTNVDLKWSRAILHQDNNYKIMTRMRPIKYPIKMLAKAAVESCVKM